VSGSPAPSESGSPVRDAGEHEQGQFLVGPLSADPARGEQPGGGVARVEQKLRLALGGRGEVPIAAPPRRDDGPPYPGELGDVGHRHEQRGFLAGIRWHRTSALSHRFANGNVSREPWYPEGKS